MTFPNFRRMLFTVLTMRWRHSIIYNKKLLEKAGYKGDDIMTLPHWRRSLRYSGSQSRALRKGLLLCWPWFQFWLAFYHTPCKFPLYSEFKDTGNLRLKKLRETYPQADFWSLYQQCHMQPNRAWQDCDDAVAEFVNGDAVFLPERKLGIQPWHQEAWWRCSWYDSNCTGVKGAAEWSAHEKRTDCCA